MKVVITRRRLLGFFVVIALTVIVVGIGIFLSNLVLTENQSISTTNTRLSSREDAYKNRANDEEGKRAYISDLNSRSEYETAKNIALELLRDSGNPSDAVELATICHIRDVSNKNDCFKKASSIVETKYGGLDFYTSYGAAEIFELNNYNKLAKQLYVHALSLYPNQTQQDGLAIKTYEELKSHIESMP